VPGIDDGASGRLVDKISQSCIRDLYSVLGFSVRIGRDFDNVLEAPYLITNQNMKAECRFHTQASTMDMRYGRAGKLSTRFGRRNHVGQDS
jgi:hypothetical protein